MWNRDGERGATAILVAASVIVLMGFAAIAVDLGAGYTERRQDQTAADVGVMAGAVDTLGTNAQIRDQVLDFTRRNLSRTYTNAEWQSAWETCSDSELSGLNASGFNFITVPAPTGWTVSRIDCISIDPAGFVRVRVPDQVTETTFGRVIGSTELVTSADAIARLRSRGSGGILPFGVLAGAAEGDHICLRDNSGGLAEPPCDGPSSGNFGAIESMLYGNVGMGTTKNCNGSPKSDVLAINIALGLDHRVVPDADGSTSNEVRDTCGNIDAGLTPDTLNTFQGLSNGMPEGLATGPVPGGFTPRLQQGSNPKVNVHGFSLDNRPQWYYIDGSLTSADVPASCVKSSFNTTNADFDWDGDGIDDPPNSWQHMSACLQAYAAGSYTTPLFLETIRESPRFAYVPQFWENTWPSGNSEDRHIRRFKAVWLQTTWWKKGNTVDRFDPGETGPFPAGGNWALRQLSGILIPDSTLPQDLRGDPPPFGGLEPFRPELYR